MFSESLATCDGSSFEVIAAAQCKVSIETLMAAPYNLAAGASVYAKVLAYNSIGSSIESAVGNGAVVKLSSIPDAPILTQDKSATNRRQVALVWTDGAYNGGQPVIDYQISSDQGVGTWRVIR